MGAEIPYGVTQKRSEWGRDRKGSSGRRSQDRLSIERLKSDG